MIRPAVVARPQAAHAARSRHPRPGSGCLGRSPARDGRFHPRNGASIDAQALDLAAEHIAARRPAMQQRAPSRASVIRPRLIDAIAPIRSLLVTISKLPWQASGEHPVLDALDKLQAQYTAGTKSLPADVSAPRLGPAWREVIADADRERAFRALEVATLFALRRAPGEPASDRAARVARAHRTDAAGGYQPAWRLPVLL